MTYDTDQNALLDRFLEERPGVVADLGAGGGNHVGYLVSRGARVDAVDLNPTDSLRRVATRFPDRCRIIVGDVMRPPFRDESVAAIWSSHCLEHTLNPLAVLAEWRRVLRPAGLLGIVVPPFKTQVVGRHVFTGWTVGQLMLTLFRAGFEIRHGAYLRLGYNVCAIVRRTEEVPNVAANDEILCRYHDRFPPRIDQEILAGRRTNPFGETIGCFEGEIDRLGW